MSLKSSLKATLTGLMQMPEEGTSPERYRVLRRNIIILMLLITIIPLFLMAFINYHQYQSALKDGLLMKIPQFA